MRNSLCSYQRYCPPTYTYILSSLSEAAALAICAEGDRFLSRLGLDYFGREHMPGPELRWAYASFIRNPEISNCLTILHSDRVMQSANK
jgi:hypothetical protein